MSTFARTNTAERCFLGAAAFGAVMLIASLIYYVVKLV